MSLDYRNEEPQIEQTEEQTEKYQRASFVMPVYPIILVACLVVVFLCQLYFNLNFSILLAGFDKQLFSEGQYWRILTGAALHGNLLHLFFNCYALYILGKLIETLSNRSHLAIVFLLSAIGGGILSLIFVPEARSVGASGGVIGFLGYLTAYGFKRRKLLPPAFLKNMLFNIAFIGLFGILVNMNQSENAPMIDNFGHLGGLLVGAVYGFLQIPSDLYKDPREIGQATKILGFLSLGIFMLTAVFSLLVLLGTIKIQFPAFVY